MPVMLFRRFLPLVFAAATFHIHTQSAHAGADVPFVVTPDHVTLSMLRLADVNRHDYVIDLGSGDGRIVITAARHFGARGLGVEIVPELVQRSKDNARKAGVAQRAEFREQDIFKTDLSEATVITMYLLPEVNLQLRPALLALKPGTRIVSHDWDMGEWRPDRVLTLPVPDKKVGREKLSRVYLWTVPPQVAGTWCGSGKYQASTLQMKQAFQDVEGALQHQGTTHTFSAAFRGNDLRARKGTARRAEFELVDDELILMRGRGAFGTLQGARFSRATNGTCA